MLLMGQIWSMKSNTGAARNSKPLPLCQLPVRSPSCGRWRLPPFCLGCSSEFVAFPAWAPTWQVVTAFPCPRQEAGQALCFAEEPHKGSETPRPPV